MPIPLTPGDKDKKTKMQLQQGLLSLAFQALREPGSLTITQPSMLEMSLTGPGEKQGQSLVFDLQSGVLISLLAQGLFTVLLSMKRRADKQAEKDALEELCYGLADLFSEACHEDETSFRAKLADYLGLSFRSDAP